MGDTLKEMVKAQENNNKKFYLSMQLVWTKWLPTFPHDGGAVVGDTLEQIVRTGQRLSCLFQQQFLKLPGWDDRIRPLHTQVGRRTKGPKK